MSTNVIVVSSIKKIVCLSVEDKKMKLEKLVQSVLSHIEASYLNEIKALPRVCYFNCSSTAGRLNYKICIS